MSSLSSFGCSGSDSKAPAEQSADVTIAKSSIVQAPPSAVPASALSAAVAANNAFAVDLYAHVLQEPATNVLTSPISASLALTMTYAGANGATKAEMASALHLDPSAGDQVFAGQNALSQALNGRAAAALANAKQGVSPDALPPDSDYQLQVVNSVWGEKTYGWEQPFLDILAANYGTGVYQQDFIHSYDSARLTINDWVDTHTNDKIKDLLPGGSLDANTRMVLVNAIHLKLPWDSAFEVQQTLPGHFTRSDSSKVSISFMNQTRNFAYVDDGQAQVVSLPLSNRELSIVIALPHADVTLAQYEATLPRVDRRQPNRRSADARAHSGPERRGQPLSRVEQSAHAPQEIFQGERLLQEGRAWARHSVAQDGVVGVAGHEQHLGVGPRRGDMLGQLAPAHAGHDDVCDQQIDAIGVVFFEWNGFEAVFGGQHFVASGLQHFEHEPTYL
jgi:serine protease inhibitor